jgi:hypothetical protein
MVSSKTWVGVEYGHGYGGWKYWIQESKLPPFHAGSTSAISFVGTANAFGFASNIIMQLLIFKIFPKTQTNTSAVLEQVCSPNTYGIF